MDKYHFTVISVEDDQAKQQSKQFKNVEFIYVNQSNKLLNRLVFQMYRVLKHMNIYIPFSPSPILISFAIDYIKYSSFPILKFR